MSKHDILATIKAALDAPDAPDATVMLASRQDNLRLAIHAYGEACENFGLANPLNRDQCERAYVAKRKALAALLAMWEVA